MARGHGEHAGRGVGTPGMPLDPSSHPAPLSVPLFLLALSLLIRKLS